MVTVVLAMLVGIGVVAYNVGLPFFPGGGARVSDYTGEGKGPLVQVVVPRGATGTAIAKVLVEADVVATENAFVSAYKANPSATSIQPGTYNMNTQMSAAVALAWLLDPNRRATLRVTIPEGRNEAQILQLISERTPISLADLQAAVADPASIGLPEQAGGIVEGWLFPATYDIEPDATAVSVLSQMTAKTVEVLRSRDVPESRWQTVLIKASMIEREAGRDVDRAPMARAIENRLARDMVLQIDATVEYGAGRTVAQMTPQEWVAARSDPSNLYNTYLHRGLPPGPIASPGAASIDAVLSPAQGDWLYWVTVNPATKETKFATTLAEHQQYIEELRAWVAEQRAATASPAP
ncbi:MAG: endolytic transglycosylase MltG [Micrococcales bacterium]|nr:endolytic transglycosylase MltG [Micrococcales bacterium]